MGSRTHYNIRGGRGSFFLVSLLLQIKPPTITGKRWKRSVEDNSEVWSLDLGLRILGVKEVSCKRRLVCDLHSLLLSCPIWLRAPIRLITSRLSTNPYRLAVKRGLGGRDCTFIYSGCRVSNLEILASAWPNLARGRRSY